MDAEGITILSQRRDSDMISFNIAININETTCILLLFFQIFRERFSFKFSETGYLKKQDIKWLML